MTDTGFGSAADSERGPVRVLHVVRPASGGIRRHVLGLVDGLDPVRVTSSIAATAEFVRDALRHTGLHAGIPLDIAPRLSWLRDLRAARRLARVRPQFAGIVHAHGVRAAWIAALAQVVSSGSPFPLFFTAHNLLGSDRVSRLALPLIARRCTKIIAVSPSVAESLASCGVPHGKIVVIPNGIECAAFALPALPSRALARAALSLSGTAFVVAAAARLSQEKGIDILLEAARQRLGVTFLIAGGGPLQAALSQSAPPNVRFLGQMEDVRPLLAAADVLAVPSRREGQGIAALEAMAAGLPVIASNVGGLADMLTDSETALLVPPADPDALAAALSRLQSDPLLRARLASNAAALVRERYTQQAMLDDLTALYEQRSGILNH